MGVLFCVVAGITLWLIFPTLRGGASVDSPGGEAPGPTRRISQASDPEGPGRVGVAPGSFQGGLAPVGRKAALVPGSAQYPSGQSRGLGSTGTRRAGDPGSDDGSDEPEGNDGRDRTQGQADSEADQIEQAAARARAQAEETADAEDQRAEAAVSEAQQAFNAGSITQEALNEARTAAQELHDRADEARRTAEQHEQQEKERAERIREQARRAAQRSGG
jgi:hypothetical protein